MRTRTGHSDEQCENCEAPLKTHRERREGFCSSIRCRGRALAELSRKARDEQAARRARREQFAETVGELLASCDDVQRTVSDNTVLVVVPSLQVGIVKQPQDRIDEFRTNLEEAAGKAPGHIKTEVDREMVLNTFDISDAVDTPLAIINSCTTCRGYCCQQGAGHAFLTSEAIARRLLNEPDQTPESIVSDYMSRVPEYAFEGSCVYHAAEGCVLPTLIRGSTCNSFRCTGLFDALAEWTPDRPTLVAAIEGNTCERAATMLPSGERQEFVVGREIADATDGQ